MSVGAFRHDDEPVTGLVTIVTMNRDGTIGGVNLKRAASSSARIDAAALVQLASVLPRLVSTDRARLDEHGWSSDERLRRTQRIPGEPT